MFDTTEDVTVNSVAKTLTRQTDGSYKATYGLDDGGVSYYTMRIEHNVPSSPNGTNESHFVRLDCDRYDTEGVHTRQDSAYFVIKTGTSKQNTVELTHIANALAGFLTSANIDKLVAREA